MADLMTSEDKPAFSWMNSLKIQDLRSKQYSPALLLAWSVKIKQYNRMFINPRYPFHRFVVLQGAMQITKIYDKNLNYDNNILQANYSL